jgi:hypothetical protein
MLTYFTILAKALHDRGGHLDNLVDRRDVG